MKAVAVAFAIAACAPSLSAVFGPVDREVERRIGVGAVWHDEVDGRVPRAIAELLQKPLDRDAAVRIAVATNRRLQAEYDRLGVAASEIASATVLAPVRIDVAYKLALGERRSEIEVDAIQDVLDLIQLPQRRGVARAERAGARARAVVATIELVARVEGAYIDIVAAQQDLELWLIGVDTRGLDARIGRVVPGYMTMGQNGMGEMMAMQQPTNSISMVGGDGPQGYIDMGGMFTILKVREKLSGNTDPGWYVNPPGTVATKATAEELARDGITI